MKDEETAKLFVEDPRAALLKMKVPLSPLLRARLKRIQIPPELLKPKGIQLPTGQVVVPKVRIRIVGEEDQEGDTRAR